MERHRDFGCDVPMIDIDCLEFDEMEPIAIIEVKRTNEQLSYMQYYLLQRAADKMHLPLFIIRHADNFASYKVKAANRLAKNFLPMNEPVKEMTEREWVTLLYRLRRRTPPDNLFSGDKLKVTNHHDRYKRTLR